MKQYAWDPNFAATYRLKGVALHSLCLYESAIESLNSAIQLNPSFANAYYARGVCYYHLNRYENAITSLDVAIRYLPNFAIAYAYRGNCYHKMQQYQKAIESYDISIRLDPNDSVTRSDRNIALEEMKPKPSPQIVPAPKIEPPRRRGVRVALMISNANYPTNDTQITALNTPPNDIELVSSKLQELGFSLTCIRDVTTVNEFQDALDGFVHTIQEANDSLECSLFYYAGHGTQYNNSNYLIPTHYIRGSDVPANCMSLDHIVRTISEPSGCGSKQLYVIDACRTVVGAGNTGLANSNTNSDTILYSTAPGTTSCDECSESEIHSPFAWALSKCRVMNIEFVQLAKQVTVEVKRLTNQRKRVFVSGCMDVDFYF